MKHGKKYLEAAKAVDRSIQYDPADAISTVIIFTAVPALWPKAGWRTKKNRNAISVRPMDVCVQAG